MDLEGWETEAKGLVFDVDVADSKLLAKAW